MQHDSSVFYLRVKLYSHDQNILNDFNPVLINYFLNEFSLFFSELEQSCLFVFNKFNKSNSEKNFSIKVHTQNYTKTKQYITVIRSPHKYKDSREQFNLKIYTQTLYIIFPEWLPFTFFDWIETQVLMFFSKYFKNGLQIRVEFYRPFLLQIM
jgi:ribosomal protein S10